MRLLEWLREWRRRRADPRWPPRHRADGKQLIRAPRELVDAMTARAEERGISAAELWREAARRLLES